LHHDFAGSAIGATDINGAVIWKEDYKPYGERVQNAPLAAGNRQFFTGKPLDADTGLSYMGARYYDPAMGRFMGIDPVGFQEGNLHSFNRYAYANNNPYRFVDPDGNEPVEVRSPDWMRAVIPGQVMWDNARTAFANEKYGVGIAAVLGMGTEIGIAAASGGTSQEASLIGKQTVTVGRWMSESEHALMMKTGKVQESLSGTTHVANPANIEAFIKQAAPGSRYVEFGVPMESIKMTSPGWAKIAGPNSLEGRLAVRKGLDPPKMPTASDISWIASKLK
jgi:RHS repeat-associated protein